MLTSQTGVLLCDKSDHSHRKPSPNSPSLIWWMNKPARVLETWGLPGNATNLSVSIVFNGLWFPWVRTGMCVCVCIPWKEWMLQSHYLSEMVAQLWQSPSACSLAKPNSMKLITPTPGPHLWLYFSRSPLSLSLCRALLISYHQKINALKMHAYRVLEY